MLVEILQTATLSTLCLLLVCLIAAGFMKGTIGVGMPIVALPLLSMLLDVRASVMLLSMPLVLSNIPQALEGGRTVECFKRLVPVLAGMIPGLLVGVILLLRVEPYLAKAVAGAAVISVALLTLSAPRFSLRPAVQSPVGVAAGFFGGALGGLAAMPGPLVFTFLIAKGLTGKAFTKEASLFLVLSAALLATSLYSSPMFNWTDVAISAVAVFPVLLGMLFGQRLRDRLKENLFKRIVLAVVVASGASLILRALT